MSIAIVSYKVRIVIKISRPPLLLIGFDGGRTKMVGSMAFPAPEADGIVYNVHAADPKI